MDGRTWTQKHGIYRASLASRGLKSLTAFQRIAKTFKISLSAGESEYTRLVLPSPDPNGMPFSRAHSRDLQTDTMGHIKERRGICSNGPHLCH